MLITNIDLARSMIARYTNFLSIAASAADLTLLEPPALLQDQANPIRQRQEIHHIHNCIEQNTMVSVNLNLQFLNQMITRAVAQIGQESRHADQMLQRPMVMDSTTKPGSIRLDAPATQILLRELRQREIKEISRATSLPPASSDPARTLLRRSLTQLVTQAAHPVTIEYPTPAPGRDAEALTRPVVRSLPPTAALPQPRKSMADSKTYSAPTQPPEPLPLLHPTLPPPAGAVQTGKMGQGSALPPSASPATLVHPAAEAPHVNLPPITPITPTTPASTPLVHPVTEAPTHTLPHAPTSLVHPATEAPTHTLPHAPTSLAHPATETPPANQPPTIPTSIPLVHPATETPRANLPPVPAPMVHPAAEAPPQSGTVLQTPSLSQRAEAPVSASPTPFIHPVADAPHANLPPTPTPLVHPAAEVLPQPPITLKTSSLSQRTEAPRPTPPPTPAARVHPAAEALPQPNITLETPTLPQRTEDPPLTTHPTLAARVHPAVEAPPQPSPAISRPHPWQPITPVGIGQRAALQPSGKPFPMQSNQVPMVHPGTAMAQGTVTQEAAAQESIATRLSPTHRVTRIYRKGTLPARGSESPMEWESQPSQLTHLSPQSPTPVSRLLREEPRPAARPKPRESLEQEADTEDIPTVRVQRKETREVQQQAIHENVAINAPQNHKNTIPTEQPVQLPEAELLRITNQVYRTLENRLRNEKMRRGMW